MSNVYGRPDVVAPLTRERVLAAAAELDYGGPSAVGRTLRRGSTEVLGILVNVGIPYTFSDPGAALFMRGVAQGADEADLSLQVVHASGPNARRRVNNTAADAFIACVSPRDDPALHGRDRTARCRSSPSGRRAACRPSPMSLPTTSAEVAAPRSISWISDSVASPSSAARSWASSSPTESPAGARGAPPAGIDWSTVLQSARGQQPDGGEGRRPNPSSSSERPGERWGILAATDVLALGAMHALRLADVDVPNEGRSRRLRRHRGSSDEHPRAHDRTLRTSSPWAGSAPCGPLARCTGRPVPTRPRSSCEGAH